MGNVESFASSHSQDIAATTGFALSIVVLRGWRSHVASKRSRGPESGGASEVDSSYGAQTSDADRVLSYWFDGPMGVNYRSKWFPSGSKDVQREADLAVSTLFGDTFEQALTDDGASLGTGIRSRLARILVLDQFSRHIYRDLPAGCPERLEADRRALAQAEELMDRCEHWSTRLSAPEFAFALMPFRHTSTIPRLKMVLDLVDRKFAQLGDDHEVLQRFQKQTTRRLQHLQDRHKAATVGDILKRHAFRADESKILDEPLVRATEAFLRKHFADNRRRSSASSSSSADADSDAPPSLFISLSGGVDSMVISKILAVLRDHGRITFNATEDVATGGAAKGQGGKDQRRNKKENRVLKEGKRRLEGAETQTDKPSGDASAELDVEQVPRRDSIRIVAMHIDYANRAESGAEAEFVHDWAVRELGLEWRLREINEVTRGITDRSEYEKVSRNIRYNFYKETLSEFGCFYPEGVDASALTVGSADIHTCVHGAMRPGVGVMFGHHIGDVQENVISNVMRGGSPLYLSGMHESGETEGVCVWRPLLMHTKEQVYAFAHKYGVPYTQDTTPSWSTRGKLRNNLIPLLQDLYGSGCLQNLSSLAFESDAMRELVQTNIFGPFLKSVHRYPCGISAPLLKHRNQPLAFWMEALKQLMHSMSMSLVREKAVQTFMERIQRTDGVLAAVPVDASVPTAPFSEPTPRIEPGWVELRKGFNTYIDENSNLCILVAGALRPSGSAFQPSAASSRGGTGLSDSYHVIKCSVNEGQSLQSCESNNISNVAVEKFDRSWYDEIRSYKGTHVASDPYGLSLSPLPFAVRTDFDVEASASSPVGQPIFEVRLGTRLRPHDGAGRSLMVGYSNPNHGPARVRWIDCDNGVDGAQSQPVQNHIDGFGFFIYVGHWLIFVEFVPNVPETLLLQHELTCQGAASGHVGGGTRPETPTNIESVLSEEDELADDGSSIWRWSKRRNTEDILVSEIDLVPELTDLYDVLGGSFRYEFKVEPKHCAMLDPERDASSDAADLEAAVVLQLCTGVTASAARDAGIDALRGIDGRIREGLPIVCPSIREDETRAKASKSGGRNRGAAAEATLGLVRVTYAYRKAAMAHAGQH